jgi:two-component system, NarL family, sensor kinase
LDAVLHNMDGGDLEIVEEIKAAVAADRAAQVAVRALVGELLQSPTGPHGLTEAVRRLLTDLATKQGVAVRHDLEAIEAPHTVNELLFGAAREAARNAIQHGKSRSIEVTLQEREGIAELTVTDDGVGFDPGILAGLNHHYGLRLLRERCETAGGSLQVRSSPGEGTTITARVPISPSGSGKLAAGDGDESAAG